MPDRAGARRVGPWPRSARRKRGTESHTGASVSRVVRARARCRPSTNYPRGRNKYTTVPESLTRIAQLLDISPGRAGAWPATSATSVLDGPGADDEERQVLRQRILIRLAAGAGVLAMAAAGAGGALAKTCPNASTSTVTGKPSFT